MPRRSDARSRVSMTAWRHGSGDRPNPTPPGLGNWSEGTAPDGPLDSPTVRVTKSSRRRRRPLIAIVAVCLASWLFVTQPWRSAEPAPETVASQSGSSPGSSRALPTTLPSPRPTSPTPVPSAGVPADGPPALSPVSPPTAASAPAVDAAASLIVKGRAPVNNYDRELFGPAWQDVDRNGCDTRNDVLRRDLQDVVLKPDTNGCVVQSGTLDDPYSGQAIAFVRGSDTSSLVQIDHVVALADAWQKGAQQWDEAKRVEFANDPLNLLAVDGELNQQKGAGDVATWLPPERSTWCSYAARVVAVKVKYGLAVTVAERDTLVRILTDCPGESLVGSAP